MDFLLKEKLEVTPENLFELIQEMLISSRIIFYPRWVVICNFGLNFWGILLEDKYAKHPEDHNFNKLAWDIGELANQRAENRTIDRPGKIIGWIKVSSLQGETSLVKITCNDSQGEEAIQIMNDLVSRIQELFENRPVVSDDNAPTPTAQTPDLPSETTPKGGYKLSERDPELYLSRIAKAQEGEEIYAEGNAEGNAKGKITWGGVCKQINWSYGKSRAGIKSLEYYRKELQKLINNDPDHWLEKVKTYREKEKRK